MNLVKKQLKKYLIGITVAVSSEYFGMRGRGGGRRGIFPKVINYSPPTKIRSFHIVTVFIVVTKNDHRVQNVPKA